MLKVGERLLLGEVGRVGEKDQPCDESFAVAGFAIGAASQARLHATSEFSSPMPIPVDHEVINCVISCCFLRILICNNLSNVI